MMRRWFLPTLFPLRLMNIIRLKHNEVIRNFFLFLFFYSLLENCLNIQPVAAAVDRFSSNCCCFDVARRASERSRLENVINVLVLVARSTSACSASLGN